MCDVTLTNILQWVQRKNVQIIDNTMKNKKYHIVWAVPKSYKKILETDGDKWGYDKYPWLSPPW